MNIQALIRKHKISLITNEPLSATDKEIIDFIEDKLSNLIRFEERYQTFFIDNSKIVLEIIKPSLILLPKTILCYNIWCDLQNKYTILHDNVQSLVKYMINRILKIDVNENYIQYSDLFHTHSWKHKYDLITKKDGISVCEKCENIGIRK